MSHERRGPLTGITVVEVAIFAFVPSAGAILAEWGADVIKVEHPVDGDPQRSIAAWGVPAETHGVNHLFEFANRGKRSIGIDLATTEGRELLMELVDDADVFLTNFLPPARRRLGIEPDDVRGRNQRIVYARGSAQGPSGADAERGGFDSISYWGRTGASVGVTPPDEAWPLTMPGPGFGDLQSGMALAGAVAAALYERSRTGLGCVVDVSLMSVGLWAMGMTISGTSMLDTDVLPHLGHADAPNPLVNLYRTADSQLVSLGFLQSDRYWPELCRLLDRPDLLADTRFSGADARARHSVVLVSLLEDIFAERTLEAWRDLLGRQDGQWDVILPPGRVRDDPQVRANGYVQVRTLGPGAELALVAAPGQFDGKVAEISPAPRAGSDTEAILTSRGVGAERLADLRARGIVS